MKIPVAPLLKLETCECRWVRKPGRRDDGRKAEPRFISLEESDVAIAVIADDQAIQTISRDRDFRGNSGIEATAVVCDWKLPLPR